jgi:CrcB protein
MVDRRRGRLEGGAGVTVWEQAGWLSVGGAVGVNARFWLGQAMQRVAGQGFPWATWAINVSGSFAIGLLTVVLARWLPHPAARLAAVTGFLGGFTTYSTFALEGHTLWERGDRGLAAVYVAATVAAGVVAVTLGLALGRAVTERDLREGMREPVERMGRIVDGRDEVEGIEGEIK